MFADAVADLDFFVPDWFEQLDHKGLHGRLH
jgi:hypothetical protein